MPTSCRTTPCAWLRWSGTLTARGPVRAARSRPGVLRSPGSSPCDRPRPENSPHLWRHRSCSGTCLRCFDPVVAQVPIGELLVELLQAGGGLDVGVDAGQVGPVAGRGDPPVGEVPDAPLDADADPGEAAVETGFDAAQVDVGPLLEGRVHTPGAPSSPRSPIPPLDFRTSSTQPASRKQGTSCQLPGNARLTPMSRPCGSTRSSHVHPVAAMGAGGQIGAVPPADGRHQSAIDQTDPAGDQRRQVGLVRGAEHLGEEGHHRLVLAPGSRLADAEVFAGPGRSRCVAAGTASAAARPPPTALWAGRWAGPSQETPLPPTRPRRWRPAGSTRADGTLGAPFPWRCGCFAYTAHFRERAPPRLTARRATRLIGRAF